MSEIKDPFLPKFLDKVKVPPIKCQGIKTKLVEFILSNIKWDEKGVWYEPFLGSGVISFNAAPEKAILSDKNPHIINFYKSIQNGEITPEIVRAFLEEHGEKLAKSDDSVESYYYKMRDIFNETKSPLYFLFLNRSSYNGIIRFNKNEEFNTPFCKKPNRFSRNLISKIVNQVSWVQELLQEKEYKFKTCSWEKAIKKTRKKDFVYLDPPYFGRNATYFNSWEEKDALKLVEWTNKTKSGFAITMWLKNKYRENDLIKDYSKNNITRKYVQFYFVGSKISKRYKMEEALIINPNFATKVINGENQPYRNFKEHTKVKET